MSNLKIYNPCLNVLEASRSRIKFTFDNFEKIYIAYSGGKDSTVMLHLVLEEAMKRNRRVGVLYVDLEAQYTLTIDHSKNLFAEYSKYIELYWVCLPISLRNAVSNFQPKWTCWDSDKKDIWVRDLPEHAGVVSDSAFFPFFVEGYEFEEFVPEFGKWYSEGKNTACLVGIRTDESLNRFRTIASENKTRFKNKTWTTLIEDGTQVYNIYPIYDWKVSDLWLYHSKYPKKQYNPIYDYMFKAGLSPAQMRLCQPYGDDQKKGLWLYHILEPSTWFRVLNRVNGTTSGALYASETGNITGVNKIYKPENQSWESFCHLLLKSLPKTTAQHYLKKFRIFIKWWKNRGYAEIPQEVPLVLENKKLAPSWRRLCKTLLRNDYWCKGLGFTQPRSEAYGKYLQIKKRKKKLGLL
jgi:predicted phosphoadenosine phosphosulfate sulfurtransferase